MSKTQKHKKNKNKNRTKRRNLKRVNYKRRNKSTNMRNLRGGDTINPFIGKAWGANEHQWPGVNDTRNYYEHNTYSKDPKMMINATGGKKRKGGGLIPQPILSLGDNLSFNVKSGYNTLAGFPQPVNPAPYKDQLVRLNNHNNN